MADRLPPGYRRSTYRRSLGPRQSTSALTAKLLAFAVVATVAIGLLIATQMASGSDPALGPKAVAQAKKKKAARSTSGSSSAATGSGSGGDPYGQVYGGDGYYYYGNGSSGYSGSSGSSSQSGGSTYTAPPVTSSTS